jgi:hypothetical protein
MRTRLSLLAAAVVILHPLAVRAAVECPPGTEPKGGVCLSRMNPVIAPLTPTLTPGAASLAAPPSLLGKLDVALKISAAAAPNFAVSDSAPSSQKTLSTLCMNNRAALQDPTLSGGMAAQLRNGIELRCRQAFAAPNKPLNRENVFEMTRSVADPSTASLASAAVDQAASTPQGAALSLEQQVLVGVTDFVVARAEQELVDYVARDFAGKLCSTSATFPPLVKGQPPVVVDLTQVFPRACAVLGSFSTTADQTGMPLDLRQIGSTFVQALKQDEHDFPQVFLNAARMGTFCRSQDCQNAASIAVAVYQAVEAARAGGSPILAVGTAAKSIDCKSGDSRGCAVHFVGIVLEAFSAQYKTLQSIKPEDGADVAALVDLLAANVILQVQNDSAASLLQPFVSDLDKLRNNLQALVAPVCQVVSDVGTLRTGTPADQKAALSLDIVENLTTIWSLGLPDINADDRAKLVNIVKDVQDAWTADQTGQYDRLFADLFSLSKDLNIYFPLPASVQQYLPLITALTTAQTSDQVTAAFEKYAAPLGSWRDKQTGRRSLTLNAFAGGALGAIRSTGGGSSAGRLALFVPVGFDYTFNRHFGLFFSVADLGNLAEIRFRQGNQDTEVADAHLRDVVSPGVWLRYSVINTPLALGLGGSLRRQTDSAPSTTSTVWQVGVFVAVDVPIFSLYRGGAPN